MTDKLRCPTAFSQEPRPLPYTGPLTTARAALSWARNHETAILVAASAGSIAYTAVADPIGETIQNFGNSLPFMLKLGTVAEAGWLAGAAAMSLALVEKEALRPRQAAQRIISSAYTTTAELAARFLPNVASSSETSFMGAVALTGATVMQGLQGLKKSLPGMADRVARRKLLFEFGFWANTGSALTESAIAFAAIGHLPPSAWGIGLLPAADLVVTVRLREKIRKGVKRSST